MEDLRLFKLVCFNLNQSMNIHNSQETKKIIGANPLTLPFYENNLIIGLAYGLIIDFQCSVYVIILQ